MDNNINNLQYFQNNESHSCKNDSRILKIIKIKFAMMMSLTLSKERTKMLSIL